MNICARKSRRVNKYHNQQGVPLALDVLGVKPISPERQQPTALEYDLMTANPNPTVVADASTVARRKPRIMQYPLKRTISRT